MTINSNLDTTLSNQIYLSRDQIRNQIIEYLQYYLEIENVDLVKSSFLSFVVNTLATLTSNILFYSSSCYNEFFLTKAKLPETIFDLSAFLGYNPSEASYATVNVLMSIPFGFTDSNTTFQIPKYFKFYAGDTEFVTYYETTLNVVNNQSVTVTAVQDSAKIYNIPVSIDSTAAEPFFSFVLPLRQYKQTIQEFQIDEDIKVFQFVTLDIPLDGKLSTMTVEVRDPNSSSWRSYEEFQSVYLMSASDYGYVSRTTSSGRRLTFGNSLIGIQPTGGSTVKITAFITEGADGNVIASTIKTGDRIYVTDSFGKTKLVDYTMSNPSPATGGEDEESIQDIRSNSIANLVSLSRLVSDTDYLHAGVVVPDSSLGENTFPVLKRSDLKVNEVQLFTMIKFGTSSRVSAITGETVYEDTIVPTRNETYTVPSTTTYIPRDTLITSGGDSYYTLFDIYIDLMNSSAYYSYIMYEIEVVPVLVTSYGILYDLFCSKLKVSKSGDDAIFELFYNTTETDFSLCTAELTIVNTSIIHTLTNDSTNKKFTYTFSPYTLFPQGNTNLEFTITNGSGDAIATYSSEVTFNQSLNNFMLSNVWINTDETSTTIYDIPVIEKDYYDSISKKDFELNVLQDLMNVVDFKSSRMLTDFTNLKFTNTTGSMINMKYNSTTKPNCLDIGIITPPDLPSVGDRYIIGSTESGIWSNKYGQIAQCIDSTSPSWYYFVPVTDDIIYVTNKTQKYIYNGNKWVTMVYDIPLQIEMEVFKSSTYYGSDIELVNLIKDTLLTEFSSRFGPNVTLYQSEIIETVQKVTGVRNCHLIQPSSNIFFDYELTSLTETELLEYGPEYVYFNEDSISIKVYS